GVGLLAELHPPRRARVQAAQQIAAFRFMVSFPKCTPRLCGSLFRPNIGSRYALIGGLGGRRLRVRMQGRGPPRGGAERILFEADGSDRVRRCFRLRSSREATQTVHYGRGAGFRDFLCLPPAQENRASGGALPINRDRSRLPSRSGAKSCI